MFVLKSIAKTVYYLVLFVILSIAGLLLISLFPFQDNYQVKVVLSGSMEPAIPVGSVVVIKSAPQYNVGDVITFGKDTKQEIPVTHRILKKEQVGRNITYITKGDANQSADGGVVFSRDVIGKTLFQIPYLGFVLEFAKEPLGFIALVVIPALLIVVSEVFKISIEVVRMVKKRHGKTNMNIPVRAVPQEITPKSRVQTPNRPKKYI